MIWIIYDDCIFEIFEICKRQLCGSMVALIPEKSAKVPGVTCPAQICVSDVI